MMILLYTVIRNLNNNGGYLLGATINIYIIIN